MADVSQMNNTFHPTEFFGYPAAPKGAVHPDVIASATLADVFVEVLRWNVEDFTITGLQLTHGWVLTMSVSGRGRTEYLQQRRSVVYVASAIAGLRTIHDDIPQGDGISSPKWYKCDRMWPVHRDHKGDFIGQFVFNDTVVYLFDMQIDDQRMFGICTDNISRQDAEEHYADEESGG